MVISSRRSGTSVTWCGEFAQRSPSISSSSGHLEGWRTVVTDVGVARCRRPECGGDLAQWVVIRRRQRARGTAAPIGVRLYAAARAWRVAMCDVDVQALANQQETSR